MIKATNLTFNYGMKPIFEQVSFTIVKNHKVGLVGPNGSGKSTLLKLILGQEHPDDGKLKVKGAIGYVPQEVKQDPDLQQSSTIRDYLDPRHQHLDHQLKLMLKGVELPRLNFDQPPQKLSGGQKTKMALIRALLSQPDILLLDEPTNFMDTAGTKWVMNFLSTYPKTLVIISHDLKLLDRSIDKVLYVNIQTHQIDEYTGNYTQFNQLKKERDRQLNKQIQVQTQQIKRMQDSLTKMARYTSEKGVRQRTQLKRRLQKIKDNLPDPPMELKKFRLQLPTPANVGSLPIQVKNLTKSFSKQPVLSDLSFYIERGERIALIGPNGSGKSTLIKLIMGMYQPDSGTVTTDPQIKVGYYSQEYETLDLSDSVISTLQNQYVGHQGQLRSFLGGFMFHGDQVFQSVQSLSGGEKTRLSIALLMLHDYNLLILDEPTTYLDVLSQRIILEALKQYTGTMIVVSHTEEFISELKPDRVILLPQQKIDYWDSKYFDLVSEI